jgi:hypothetical protein
MRTLMHFAFLAAFGILVWVPLALGANALAQRILPTRTIDSGGRRIAYRYLVAAFQYGSLLAFIGVAWLIFK